MSKLDLDPKTAALIVIDLQRGIVARDVEPRRPHDADVIGRVVTALMRDGTW